MTRTSLFNFIVTPLGQGEYNNRTEKGLILNNMVNHLDGQFINRLGLVEVAPENNPTSAQVGDIVYVQHNTFRRTTDLEGKMQSGRIISDKEFFVPGNLIIAYQRDGEWYSTNNWTHGEPIEHKNKGLMIHGYVLRPDKANITFKMDPKYDGYDVGTNVTFRKDKFVEDKFNEDVIYRIRTKDILLQHDE